MTKKLVEFYENTIIDELLYEQDNYTLMIEDRKRNGFLYSVYCDEEETYGLLNAEEISCYCGVNLEDIDIE